MLNNGLNVGDSEETQPFLLRSRQKSLWALGTGVESRNQLQFLKLVLKKKSFSCPVLPLYKSEKAVQEWKLQTQEPWQRAAII